MDWPARLLDQRAGPKGTGSLLAAGIRVAGVDRDREPLEALQQLAEDGYLLPEDLELLVDQAAERFDVFARPSAGVAS